VNACVWYVSKYAALPAAGRGGTRAFLIMRELARAGHRAVMLISDSNHLTEVPRLTGPHLLETVEGVDVHWIRTRKFTGAKSIGRVLSWLDFELRLFLFPKQDLPRPDVVIVSSLSLLTILNGLWLKFRHRCRLVFEVRDIWPLTIVEEGGFSPRNPLVMGLAAVERLAYRTADVIVGTMPNLEAHVSEVSARHAPVHCVPFGVDVDMIEKARPLPPNWVQEHIPAGKFVVCHAGTIGITNALDTLFDCARAMRNRSDVHFLILGEGGLKHHYEALTADLPNVSFAGAVAKDQVGAALEACDLLYFSVHVSKVWNYGLSLNKVIDYMLAGKPIVASYSGYPTMVEEAGAGTALPAGDPVALAAEIVRYADMEPEARHSIGQAGRNWLWRNRQYKDVAARYLDIAMHSRNPEKGQAVGALPGTDRTEIAPPQKDHRPGFHPARPSGD
jgi:glycosyltransferase involved in cell wall biosynthesis